MERIDWLLIFIGFLWTFLIVQIQAASFSYWSRHGLPYEKTGKMLNLAIHLFLLASIWMSILGNGAFMDVNWILIVIAVFLLVVWVIISQIQRRYLERKLRIARAEFEKTKKRYEDTQREVEANLKLNEELRKKVYGKNKKH